MLVRPGLGLPDLFQQALHHGLGVAFDAHGNRVVAPDLLRVDLDLDDLGVRRDEPVVVERGGLAEPGAHGQDGVGLAHRLDAFQRPQSAQVAQVVGVVVGHGVGPSVGRYDGGAGQFRHAADYLAGIAPLHSTAGQYDRALGGRQNGGGLVDQALVSPGTGLA